MDGRRHNREITLNGWRIEAIGAWSTEQPEIVEEAIKLVVRTIESAADRPYHRSRHAVTYLTPIQAGTGSPLELYIKSFFPPRGAAALKQMIRGNRLANVIRVTGALRQAGFASPPLLLKGVHAASGRTMLASARAEGLALPDFIARLEGLPARKRELLRRLGSEVARLHRTGLVHGDLTPYNVFVTESEPAGFIFLDHDRTRPGFVVGRSYRQLRNLVQLGRFDLAGVSNTDRLRVFKAYAAGLDRTHRRAMARRVARMLSRRRRRDAGLRARIAREKDR